MSIYNTLKIYDADKKSHLEFDRNSYLKNCTKNKKILHVGCTDFPITQQRIDDNNLLHQKLLDNAKEVVGIDLSDEGISILINHGYKDVFVMDAENMKFTTKFDLILAGDVLEHMNNPGMFLDNARTLLEVDAEIIIAVPSALTFNNLKAWFLGREQVHSDHTFYFSPKTLSALCARYNLLPVKLIFTVQPPENHESAAFIFIRKIILNTFSLMAPSFIMHFKNKIDVDQTSFYEYK